MPVGLSLSLPCPTVSSRGTLGTARNEVPSPPSPNSETRPRHSIASQVWSTYSLSHWLGFVNLQVSPPRLLSPLLSFRDPTRFAACLLPSPDLASPSCLLLAQGPFMLIFYSFVLNSPPCLFFPPSPISNHPKLPTQETLQL